MAVRGAATTRQRIMEAAVTCFSADGYDAASVDEICTEAGVSKGAFYHHFPSKQALFLALLDDWLKGLDRAMQSVQKPTVPETLVEMTSMLRLAMSSAHYRLGLWLEFWVHASRDAAVWKATIAPYRRYREFFRQMIEQGIAEGSLRGGDARTTAQAILSMAVGIFLQSVLDPQGADWPETARQSMRALLAGLVQERS